MKSNDIKQRIIKLANYYNKAMTDATLDIYASHLTDLTEQDFELAVTRLVDSSKWMPTVAEIREAVMLNLIKRAGVPSPESAWSEVSKNLKNTQSVQCGTLQTVNRIDDHNWSHPMVKKAAEDVPWDDLYWAYSTGNAVAMTSNKARFLDGYKALVKDLKDYYSLSPELRQAIEPPERPALPDPQPKQIKRDKPTLQEIKDSDEYGVHTMPDHVREKLNKLLKDKEIE